MSTTTLALEKIKEEIDGKRRFVSTLPPCENRSEEGFFKAKYLKILAPKEEEYELIHELPHIALVAREHEELHPPITEECPICPEAIWITYSYSMVYFPTPLWTRKLLKNQLFDYFHLW